MPGFRVAQCGYQNTRAPNPSCCSDPWLLCPRCALTVLREGIENYHDPEADPVSARAAALARTPTTNCSRDDGDDDLLVVPDLVPPTPTANAADDVYGGDADDDLLPLPVMNFQLPKK